MPSPHTPTIATASTSGRVIDPHSDDAAVIDPASRAGLKHATALKADFGECSIGGSKIILMTITNDTPIAASVVLWLDTFQADALRNASATATAPFAASCTGTASAALLHGKLAGGRSHATLPSLTAGTSGKNHQNDMTGLTLGSAVSGVASSFVGKTYPRSHKGLGLSHKSRPSLVRLSHIALSDCCSQGLSRYQETLRPVRTELSKSAHILIVTSRFSQVGAVFSPEQPRSDGQATSGLFIKTLCSRVL